MTGPFKCYVFLNVWDDSYFWNNQKRDLKWKIPFTRERACKYPGNEIEVPSVKKKNASEIDIEKFWNAIV